MKKIKAADLGVDIKPRLETLKVVPPPERKGGGKVSILCHASDQVLIKLDRSLMWTSSLAS